jgi:hypothetical protein
MTLMYASAQAWYPAKWTVTLERGNRLHSHRGLLSRARPEDQLGQHSRVQTRFEGTTVSIRHRPGRRTANRWSLDIQQHLASTQLPEICAEPDEHPRLPHLPFLHGGVHYRPSLRALSAFYERAARSSWNPLNLKHIN